MDILKGCDYMKLIADKYNDAQEGYYTIRLSKKELDIDAGTYMEFWYKKTDDGYENTFLVVGHDSYEGGEYIDTHTVINCNYHELESYIKYYISSKLPSWQEKIRKIIKYLTKPPLYEIMDTRTVYDVKFNNGMVFRATVRDDGAIVLYKDAFGVWQEYYKTEVRTNILDIIDLIKNKEGIVELKKDF